MRKIVPQKEQGFTLVELIIVIVVITILAAAILVGVNPAKRFQQARNATRWSEVNATLEAIMKFKIDSAGNLPTGLSSTLQVLGTGSACNSVTRYPVGNPCNGAPAACLNLTTDLVTNGGYLAEIPTDPMGGTAADTGYAVLSTATGGTKVIACSAEDSESIFVQR